MTAEIIIFSPTGTTRTLARSFAEGLGCAVTFTDITRPENRSADRDDACDFLVVATPVYEERVPDFVEEYINQISGRGRPLAVLSVYGNVGYGKSLVQLRQYALDHDFHLIGAGLFIGEHSFATAQVPVAYGRPDDADLNTAVNFGKRVRDKLDTGDFETVSVPSSKPPFIMRLVPSAGARLFVKQPSANAALCKHCGVCAKLCPVAAIDADTVTVDGAKCIRCFACVKGCPFHAMSSSFRLKLFERVFLSFGKKRGNNQLYI